MMEFRSNAEEIKFYIRELLDEGGEETIQEIIAYVKERSGKEFTGGMFSGAMNDLLDREKEYRRIGRGRYAKRSLAEDTDDVFDRILKNAIQEVEQARHVDIQGLTPGRLSMLQRKYRRVLSGLQALLGTEQR